jgi:steroid delta-isomerase-like uncharacterized protein
MTAAENLAVHTAWTAAEDRHDLSHHVDYVHADIEVHAPGAHPVVGLESYLAMMKQGFEGVANWRAVLEDRFATDERVVCRWRVCGKHIGDLHGFPATGQAIEWSGISVWEFEGGKARRGWIYKDVVGLFVQLSRDRCRVIRVPCQDLALDDRPSASAKQSRCPRCGVRWAPDATVLLTEMHERPA